MIFIFAGPVFLISAIFFPLYYIVDKLKSKNKCYFVDLYPDLKSLDTKPYLVFKQQKYLFPLHDKNVYYFVLNNKGILRSIDHKEYTVRVDRM